MTDQRIGRTGRRRASALAFAAAGLLALAAGPAAAEGPAPVIFVHGDSDTAGLWMVQAWRFESNGYPRDRLRAVDLDRPSARSDDGVPQENRSSTTDVASQLGGFTARTLIETGADSAAFVGNSRGCQTIRNYVQNGGGRHIADAMILAGCVHHGVFNFPGAAQGSEYNGAGRFLTALNAGPEVPEGVKTVTIRSDRFDLYAQPTGEWIGMAGVPLNVGHDGAALEGADNRVLPGADHRETGYSPEAFTIMYEAITGKKPDTIAVTPEAAPQLDGKVSGWANGRPTNRPLAGAKVTVFPTDPETGARAGNAVHVKTVGADGMWGPFIADPGQSYEFVIEADGYPVHHIYRSPFPRSFDQVSLRLYPYEGAAAEAEGGAAIGMMRPRGYFGAQQDRVMLDGETAPGLPDSEVPGVWKVFKTLPEAAPQTVVGHFEDERLAGMAWPVDGHVSWIELTY
ncbi:hydrolase [Marinibaculum pumilum]|uniref:Hydrolase n=1 Tax=Marinibaculum pumilum TaxID=1766165 RepID=A0ABV7KVD5_9PROT